jgi:threonine dehydratase
MSGIAIGAKALKPDIALLGVEAELYPSMKCAIEGCSLPLGGDTLAEGIAVKEPGALTLKILRGLVDEILLVAERDIEHAVALLVTVEKSVVEGAGAAGLAAMLASRSDLPGARSVPFCAAATSTPICSPTCWSGS